MLLRIGSLLSRRHVLCWFVAWWGFDRHPGRGPTAEAVPQASDPEQLVLEHGTTLFVWLDYLDPPTAPVTSALAKVPVPLSSDEEGERSARSSGFISAETPQAVRETVPAEGVHVPLEGPLWTWLQSLDKRQTTRWTSGPRVLHFRRTATLRINSGLRLARPLMKC